MEQLWNSRITISALITLFLICDLSDLAFGFSSESRQTKIAWLGLLSIAAVATLLIWLRNRYVFHAWALVTAYFVIATVVAWDRPNAHAWSFLLDIAWIVTGLTLLYTLFRYAQQFVREQKKNP
jgi:hypothetical protein